MTQQLTQPVQQYEPQEQIGQQTGGVPPQQMGGGQQFGQPQQTGGGQQYGQPQQPVGGQPQQFTGGQPGGALNITLEEAMSDEMRVALHDFVEAATVAEWCADQCIGQGQGPQMSECIRLCRDVGELASLNIQLLSRDSVFGAEVAEVFATAAEACAQECAQHGEKHCQECAEVLTRAARSTRKMLASFDPGQMQGVGQGMQTQGAQSGGQF